MKAAVITEFGAPPRYTDIAEPVAGPGQMLVDVLAVGLHQLTRARAAGSHYSGTRTLPQTAGVDGVGRGADGRLHYFVQGPGGAGTLAERTVIEPSHAIELPDGIDPVTVAAAMNPAMASWLALGCRVPFEAGQKLLILGATGSSGRMAVQIARLLGAAQIIGAGRDASQLARLPALGATAAIQLDDTRLGELAAEVDIVLDFVWGEPTASIMGALLARRAERSRALTWIQAGSMAGEIAPIPGALLRAANLQIVGSGLGALAPRTILRELPALVNEIARGGLQVDARAMPLSEVAAAWSAAASSATRIVLTPR